MDLSLIIVTIISGIFSVIIISLLNHNWFKRQAMKLNNTIELKKLEYAHKRHYAKLKGSNISSITRSPSIPGIMGLLKNLDDDTILNIVDTLRGEGYSLPESSDNWISTIAKLVPKEVIEGFIKGALSKSQSAGSGESSLFE